MRFPILLLLVTPLVHGAVPAEQSAAIVRLVREQKLDAAEAAANALIAANPAEPEAYTLRATVNVAEDNPEAAVKAAEKAVALAPNNSEWQKRLGDTYAYSAQKAGLFGKIGFAKKCRAAYEKAVELDPRNINARVSLMTFYQQAPGAVGGGMDKAYAQAEEVKKLDATRGRFAYLTLYTAEKKFGEAFAQIDAMLQAAPDNYPALFQLGRVAALSGDELSWELTPLRSAWQ